MIGGTRVLCRHCQRAILTTESQRLRRHAMGGRSKTVCEGSGEDVSEQVEQLEQEDRDDFRSWMGK